MQRKERTVATNINTNTNITPVNTVDTNTKIPPTKPQQDINKSSEATGGARNART